MKYVVTISLAVLAVAGWLVAGEATQRLPSTYVDTTYGFRVQAPPFGPAPAGGNVVPVMLLGPAKDGFSPNLNVMIQLTKTTRDAFRKLSLDQFKQMGFTVHKVEERQVGGKDALLIEYLGKQQGRELRWLALAVIDTDRVYLATCTALASAFEASRPGFAACLDSFALTTPGAAR